MGRCEKWTISYRKRDGSKTILEGTDAPFKPLPNSWRYWRADPFCVDQDGKTWLFAELYDRLRLKGVLACCELTEGGPGKWRIILDEPFHLSYPFVFRHQGDWYMIPESFRSGKILLYKATSFPWEWERVRSLAQIDAVDPSLVETSAGRFLVAQVIKGTENQLAVFEVGEDLTLCAPCMVSEPNDLNVRPAGRSYLCGKDLIRPTQDCTKGYGCALNLMRIDRLDKGAFRETLLRKIQPSDVRIEGVRRIEGIHTYNFSDHYEVIDHKEYEFGLLSKIGGVIRRIRRRSHR